MSGKLWGVIVVLLGLIASISGPMIKLNGTPYPTKYKDGALHGRG